VLLIVLTPATIYSGFAPGKIHRCRVARSLSCAKKHRTHKGYAQLCIRQHKIVAREDTRQRKDHNKAGRKHTTNKITRQSENTHDKEAPTCPSEPQLTEALTWHGFAVCPLTDTLQRIMATLMPLSCTCRFFPLIGSQGK
jgi:hypothetical protein